MYALALQSHNLFPGQIEGNLNPNKWKNKTEINPQKKSRKKSCNQLNKLANKQTTILMLYISLKSIPNKTLFLEVWAALHCMPDSWKTRWQPLQHILSTALVIISAWLKSLFLSWNPFCRLAGSSLSSSFQRISGLCSGVTKQLDTAIV